MISYQMLFYLMTITHQNMTHQTQNSRSQNKRPSAIASSPLHRALSFTVLPLALLLPLAGCSEPTSENTAATSAAADGTGTLLVKANGEDFVREGFTGKDGWQIEFDHLYATMTEIEAFQSDPPFEAGKGEALESKQAVAYDTSPVTVDLAEGDTPVEAVQFADAPSGRYNALGWQLVPAVSGPAEGYPLLLIGTATKGGESVAFEIGLEEAIAYTCGDFIGDERKGILTNGETAEVEATFHFDHMFGDAEAPADDEINVGALGFGPLAELAQAGQLTIDSEGLKEQLSKEDYETLQAVFPGLGHVGEGHCESTVVN